MDPQSGVPVESDKYGWRQGPVNGSDIDQSIQFPGALHIELSSRLTAMDESGRRSNGIA